MPTEVGHHDLADISFDIYTYQESVFQGSPQPSKMEFNFQSHTKNMFTTGEKHPFAIYPISNI